MSWFLCWFFRVQGVRRARWCDCAQVIHHVDRRPRRGLLHLHRSSRYRTTTGKKRHHDALQCVYDVYTVPQKTKSLLLSVQCNALHWTEYKITWMSVRPSVRPTFLKLSFFHLPFLFPFFFPVSIPLFSLPSSLALSSPPFFFFFLFLPLSFPLPFSLPFCFPFHLPSLSPSFPFFLPIFFLLFLLFFLFLPFPLFLTLSLLLFSFPFSFLFPFPFPLSSIPFLFPFSLSFPFPCLFPFSFPFLFLCPRSCVQYLRRHISRCQIDAWSLWTTHKKSTAGSRMVTWQMTSRKLSKCFGQTVFIWTLFCSFNSSV